MKNFKKEKYYQTLIAFFLSCLQLVFSVTTYDDFMKQQYMHDRKIFNRPYSGSNSPRQDSFKWGSLNGGGLNFGPHDFTRFRQHNPTVMHQMKRWKMYNDVYETGIKHTDGKPKLRRDWVEKLQKKVLEGLDLDAVPRPPFNLTDGNINRKLWASLPISVKDKIHQSFERDQNPNDKSITESLIQVNAMPLKLDNYASMSGYFTLSAEFESHRIESAILRMETTNEELKGLDLQLFEISLIPENAAGNAMDLIETFQRSKEEVDFLSSLQQDVHYELLLPSMGNVTVPQSQGSVAVDINLTQALRGWVRRRNSVYPFAKNFAKAFMIICSKCTGNQQLLNKNKMILDLQYRNRAQRRRRSTGSEGSSGGQSDITNKCGYLRHHRGCCTEELTITTKETGWDSWILYPLNLSPNYCLGTCEASERKHLHANLLDYIRNTRTGYSDLQKEAMRSCCHPTKMANQSILYISNEGNLIMKDFSNFRILECNCS